MIASVTTAMRARSANMADVPITGPTMPKPAEHGGDLGAIRRRFPNAPLPWIDLSTGMKPVAYPVAALPIEIWSRLPTREAEQRLLTAAAHRYGIDDPATIVTAPGTQALIQLLPRLVPNSRVAIVGPTYAEHERGWRRGGHDGAGAAAPSGAPTADIAVIVNPDNATGRLIAPPALHANKPSLLCIDQAFLDCLPA